MTRISPFARAYLRGRATELMTDSCVITRPGPVHVEYDPVTRKTTTVNGTEVYNGVCRLWEVRNGARQEINGQTFTVAQTYLSIPYDAEMTEPEDQVTMTGSDDPKLVGRSLLILGSTRGGGLRGSRVMSVRFTDFEGEDK